MKSSATAEFWRHFARLPGDVQQRARKAYQLWVRDPHHNSLRVKKIGSVWSVRIYRGYRALGLFKVTCFTGFGSGHMMNTSVS
jgi:hypothetical protein